MESASLLLVQLAGQVQHRAVAGRAVVQLARARLDQGHQLARIFSGNAGVDHQHQGHGAKDADGRDVLDRTERHVFINAGVDRVCRFTFNVSLLHLMPSRCHHVLIDLQRNDNGTFSGGFWCD